MGDATIRQLYDKYRQRIADAYTPRPQSEKHEGE